MKHLVFIVTVILVCVRVEGFFFSNEDEANGIPVDCRWAEWVPGECKNIGNGELRREETRIKLTAENGGKDCEGASNRIIKTCTPAEHMAQKFVDTISQAAISSGVSSRPGISYRWSAKKENIPTISPITNLHFARTLSKDTSVCSTPYSDPENRWKMSGRACTTRSRRRKRDIRSPDSLIRSARQTRDVLFLLDESGSVGSTRFRDFLRFVKETIAKLCGDIAIAPEKTRVALTTYDSDVHDHIKFYEYGDLEQLLQKIDAVRYNSGTSHRTCLVKALHHVRDKVFTTRYGARSSRSIYDMVILVTDGCANCAGNLDADLGRAVQDFEAKDITFMLVTIGDRTSCSSKISRFANGNHCFLNYEMDNWRDFGTFVDAIRDMNTCFRYWKVPDVECA